MIRLCKCHRGLAYYYAGPRLEWYLDDYWWEARRDRHTMARLCRTCGGTGILGVEEHEREMAMDVIQCAIEAGLAVALADRRER